MLALAALFVSFQKMHFIIVGERERAIKAHRTNCSLYPYPPEYTSITNTEGYFRILENISGQFTRMTMLK